ncbi:MAG TPA: tetratricopeptide repeat protein, partial [Candidatus Acidoferrum sp.]|nr:tetratricopeptide repeat protein [Candidatus Acidoferrum sp.]
MNINNQFSNRARRTATALVLLAITFAGTAALAAGTNSPSELLEQAIYSEETKGDVDAALKLYQQVVAEAKAGQAVAAQAQYRLGVCYYKKKDYAKANAAFEKLLNDYPDQKDLIASANQYLAGAVALMPAPWADGEELQLDIKFPTGYKIGTACYAVNSGEANGQKTWRLFSRLYAVTQQASRVEVDADSFKPLHCHWKISVIGEADVTYSANSALLKMSGKDEPLKIDLSGVVYDNEEVIQLMRRLPLAPDYKTTLKIFTGLGGGTMIGIEAAVTGQEKVEVAAGTFDCYKVELSVVHQTFWYSTDAHRYLVKFEGGGVVAELSSVTQRKAGEAVTYHDRAFNFSLSAPADWLFFRTDVPGDNNKTKVGILDPDAIGTSVVNVGSRKLLWPEVQNSLRAWAEKEISDGEGSKLLKE